MLEDGRLVGPFNTILESTGIAAPFLALQAAEQKHTTLSKRVRQVFILTVGAVWRCDYERYAHEAVARQAGLPAEAIRALAQGEQATGLAAEELLAQRLTRQLTAEFHVSDEFYAEASAAFGAQSIVDLIFLAGCYQTTSSLLNAFKVPAPSLFAAFAMLPSQRHHLRNKWLWSGLLTATLLAAPNLIWLARHQFITLRMEHLIHLRDVRPGRADGYYTDQFKFTLLALPLAVLGLIALLRDALFRLLGAFYIGPFLLFALVQGRGYYLLPAYPVLYAAAAVALERVLARYSPSARIAIRAVVVTALLLDSAAVAWAYLPIWRPGSLGWDWQMKNNYDMADEVGWPQFVAQVATVRDGLPK